MSQMNIGEFIQQLRKQQNLTQKDLANQIGVSDKTISKWENGNSMPDTSMLLSLCNALDISVNELLSCEKLPPEDYSKKAEENMINLLKEQESTKKSNLISIIIGIILTVLTFAFFYLSLMGTNLTGITWFLDMPTFIYMSGICAACVLLSGAREKQTVLQVIQKTLIPAGGFNFLFSLVIVLILTNDPIAFGPSVAVALLPLIYALAGYLVLIPITQRFSMSHHGNPPINQA